MMYLYKITKWFLKKILLSLALLVFIILGLLAALWGYYELHGKEKFLQKQADKVSEIIPVEKVLEANIGLLHFPCSSIVFQAKEPFDPEKHAPSRVLKGPIKNHVHEMSMLYVTQGCGTSLNDGDYSGFGKNRELYFTTLGSDETLLLLYLGETTVFFINYAN